MNGLGRELCVSMMLLLSACAPVHYGDPNPPQLFRSTVEYSSRARSEPLVWMPLIDLFDESGTGCAAAQQWAAQALRAAMRATSTEAVELAGAMVSPQCDQPPNRGVDAATLQQQIDAAVAARPAEQVRVIAVYLNNIALPAPQAVIDGLARLRQNGYLWVLAHGAVTAQLASDHAQDWTFTWDSTLAGNLAKALAVPFPLQSDFDTVSAPRPVLGGDLPAASEVKVCKAGTGVSFVGLRGDGTASAVDPRRPPSYQVQFPQQVAVPKNLFTIQHTSFEVEGCTANCSDYSGSPGKLRRWDQTRGCLLGAP